MVAEYLGGFVQRIEPQGDLQTALLGGVFKELLCLLGLVAEGFDATFKLGDDIAQSKEVILGMGKLALGFGFAVAIAGNTRGFLEDLASVLAL